MKIANYIEARDDFTMYEVERKIDELKGRRACVDNNSTRIVKERWCELIPSLIILHYDQAKRHMCSKVKVRKTKLEKNIYLY